MPKLLKQVVVRGKAIYIDYSIYFLPVECMKDALLGMTSKNIEGIPLIWGEMLTYLGLWLLISSVATGGNTRAYWDNSDPSPFKGPPFRLHSFMSFERFYAITKALYFTDHTLPLYRDKFWNIQQMIHDWNCHMSDVFLDGWLSCLDESMSIWTSRWMCPVFMFVPRKPHPVGNEYHTIMDGLCGILFSTEISKGKDKPKERRER